MVPYFLDLYFNIMKKPPYIIETSLFYNLFAINGLAFWPFIFVYNKSNMRVVEHEKRHIKQQLEGWIIGFYIKYAYYTLRYGYKNNPYEVDARKHQYDYRKDNSETKE